MLAIDGTTLEVPDSPANAALFGRPTTHRGQRSAFPQIRLLGLAECGTHAILAAVLGPYGSGETTLAPGLFGRLGAGVLLLADRGLSALTCGGRPRRPGAELVWRAKTTRCCRSTASSPTAAT